jgi:formate-dependent phosphoribosylglycinamide formyltransferase (GAR transformylase)
MDVLMFSPGFPAEMPHFTRGLARAGARVLGVGDQPREVLPEAARDSLADYFRVPNLFDEEAVVAEVRRWARRVRIDRVECLWEPGMLLAARLREALELPGMTVEETLPFRDKSRMKGVLDLAGIRTPRHVRAASVREVREAVDKIHYPLCIKPIAGAGSADTYRVDTERRLEEILPRLRHVPEVSVEEFIEGEEYTFDTICAGGRVLYYNVSWYRPQPIIGRSEEWISPQTVALRTVEAPEVAPGIEMGQKVLQALGFRTGFTHMEWFLTPAGEAVFGEIGARPPGARSVDIMNYASDVDVYTGWAEAVCHGRFSLTVERKYNAAVIFKRAQGEGRIQHIEGLGKLLDELGEAVVCVDLLPIGAPRRDWKATLISDGYLVVRHPDLETTLAMADRVGTDLKLYAG